MLDSFSDRARTVVSIASSEARRLDHGRIGTEHLLLGLLSDGAGASGELLRSAGATLPAARHMVAEVVVADGSPRLVELPYSARAQRALERAARFSRQERAPLTDVEHILLGVLDVEGLACQVLRGLGADVGQLRDTLTGARTESSPVVASTPEEPGVEAPPRCPSCGDALDTTLAERVVHVRQDDAASKPVAVVYCTACGTALGVIRP